MATGMLFNSATMKIVTGEQCGTALIVPNKLRIG
jgi:hypothetical protein